MVLDRALREVELGGYLTVAHTLRDQGRHPLLAAGERIVRLPGGRQPLLRGGPTSSEGVCPAASSADIALPCANATSHAASPSRARAVAMLGS